MRLARPLAVHCVVSEEDGGLGAFATLRRGHTGEAAVITEPTSGAVDHRERRRADVPDRGGRAGRARRHAARRGSARSRRSCRCSRRSGASRRERNRDARPLFGDNPLPYAISVGTVRAGDWASTVPDLLVAEGRLGVRLDEDPADGAGGVRGGGRRAARDPWLRDHPPVVTWPGGQFASGRLPRRAPAAGRGRPGRRRHRRRGRAERGRAVRQRPAALRGAAGIPTLHYGPGDVAYAHAPREQVELREVREVTRALALLAVRRCGAY